MKRKNVVPAQRGGPQDFQIVGFRKYALLALPVLLTPSAAIVFLLMSQWLGKEWGYVLGFLFYWIVWCYFVPLVYLGRTGLLSLFKEQPPLFQKKNWLLVVLLLLTTVGALVMYFIPGIAHTPPLLILVAVPAATINGIGEEILWRGLYVKAFPRQALWGVILPSFGFALWHIAPQLVFPSPGGVFSLVGSAFFLGLCYGLIAYKTGSMKWTGISHSVNGILAFGGAIAPSIFRILFPK
jgi:membrane protease YdiL (CAAX protease family)